MTGGGGSGTTQGRALSPEEAAALNMSTAIAGEQAGRDTYAFNQNAHLAALAGGQVAAANRMLPQVQAGFNQAANMAQNQAQQRMQLERQMLAPGQSLINQSLAASGQMLPTAIQGAGRLNNVANQLGQSHYQSQLNQTGAQLGQLANMAQTPTAQLQYMDALRGQALSGGNQAQQALAGLGGQAVASGNQYASQLSQLGMEALNRGMAADAASAPLRQNVNQTLAQVAQGQVPDAVRNLYSQANMGERDMLEQQFRVAQQQAMEQSGAQGGALSRAMAGLQGQRAMSLVQQQGAQANAERALSRELFGQAVQAGMAPSQMLQYMQLAGNLGGQAGQLQQAGIGLGGQLQGQGAQLQQAGVGMAGQIQGQREGMRQAGLAQAGQLRQGQAGIYQGAEGLRQGALTGQGQLFNQATQTAMQGRAAQQQGLLSALQARQSLGAQYGQGADQLMLQSPALRQQGFNLGLAGAQALSIPSSILSGGPQQNIAGLLGNAGQIAAGAASTQTQQGPSRLASAGSGAMMGAGTGAMFGPYGALIGGVAGGLMGAFA